MQKRMSETWITILYLKTLQVPLRLRWAQAFKYQHLLRSDFKRPFLIRYILSIESSPSLRIQFAQLRHYNCLSVWKNLSVKYCMILIYSYLDEVVPHWWYLELAFSNWCLARLKCPLVRRFLARYCSISTISQWRSSHKYGHRLQQQALATQ